MKADERNMADSQAKVYRGSLSPNHRFSFSSLVFKQAVWLVVRVRLLYWEVKQLFQVNVEILLWWRKVSKRRSVSLVK